MKSEPTIVELNVQLLEERLNQIEQALGEEVARPFRLLLSWYCALLGLLQKKNVSVRRLRRLLFGSQSTTDSANSSTNDSTSADANSPKGISPSGEPTATSTQASADAQSKRRRAPGHGRISAKAYTGCQQVVVTHDALAPGDFCPNYHNGILHRMADWSPVVRLTGQPPVGGVCYELERLRCGLCGEVRTAELPAEAGESKHDPSVASIIATLRYGQGMPWTRLAAIQRSAGVPLPASVQWELVRDAADRGPRAAYEQLLWEAAQGDLLHNDDTHMRVLELTAKLNNQEPLHEDPERCGVFTTNVLSVAEGRPTIALFFTGARHSGENLRDLLAARIAGLPPPMQMCDALSRNLPEGLNTIVANCLSHGRRYFYDLTDVFPLEVEYVLSALKQVYEIDARAKKEDLSPEDRLRLHQQRSGPVMERLRTWLNRQFDERLVEPNSSLGRAISYMLNHWRKLTLFLREAGAPLDNNICERALKMSIRHRKNSLFYKTLRRARIGDLYMSLIHTCYLSHADAFDYLTQLQRNHERAWPPRQPTGCPGTTSAS